MKIGYAIASQSFEPQVLKGILIPYALAMNSLMSRKHSEKPWWAISLRLLQTETREAEVVRGKQSQWGFYLLGIIAAGNGMGWQPVPAKAPECSTFKTRSHFLAGAIMKMEWGNWIALICPGMVKIKERIEWLNGRMYLSSLCVLLACAWAGIEFPVVGTSREFVSA